MTPIPIERQIRAVSREISMRQRVYSRRVLEQKMTQGQADAGIRDMESVLATLEEVARLVKSGQVSDGSLERLRTLAPPADGNQCVLI